jgi:hypothetical protein
MAKKLVKDDVRFMAIEGEATAKTKFVKDAPKGVEPEQDVHKISGLPAWTVEGFLIEGEEKTIVKLNIASTEQPKFPAVVPLSIEGDLLYTPYLNNNGKLAESYTVVGKLVPAKPANRGE